MPTAKAEAEHQCRALLLSVEVREANGGRRDPWGQARLVGAGEANGGGKPPASCPGPPASKTKKATGPNP
jgi:hypothetical protein